MSRITGHRSRQSEQRGARSFGADRQVSAGRYVDRRTGRQAGRQAGRQVGRQVGR